MEHSHRIAELMTENPHSVTPNASVVEAAKIMRDDDVGLVPVVEGSDWSGR